MNSNITLAAAAIVALASTAVSCRHTPQGAQATVPTVDVAVPTVDTVTLSTNYPGTLSARTSVDVVVKVNGQLMTKNYESGRYVEAGQVLFTIDPSTYLDQVQQAKATLANAQSALQYASEHYEAVKKALESEAVSKMEVVQAQSSYEQAQAQVKCAGAALQTANRNLGYCTVTAPISGYVSDNLKSAGNYITGQGAPVVLATIYDIGTVSANFAIEDSKYQDIVTSIARRDSLGFARVPVSFEETLPHTYTGAVSYMAPSLNTSTGTLIVKCVIQNPYGELRPGMYVNVDLPYCRMPDATLIKDAAIGTDQLGKYIYVVNDSDRVVYRPVTVGPLYRDSLRVVSSGIKPGERYVTRAILKVRDGMAVKPRLQK